MCNHACLWKYHTFTIHTRLAFVSHGQRMVSGESCSHAPSMCVTVCTHLFSLPVDIEVSHAYDVVRFFSNHYYHKYYILCISIMYKVCVQSRIEDDIVCTFNTMIWILWSCKHIVTRSCCCDGIVFRSIITVAEIYGNNLYTVCSLCAV